MPFVSFWQNNPTFTASSARPEAGVNSSMCGPRGPRCTGPGGHRGATPRWVWGQARGPAAICWLRPLSPTPRPPTGSGSPGGAAGLLGKGSMASGRGMWAEQRGALGLLWLLEGGVTIWGFSWVCVLVQSSRVFFEAVISLFL